MEWSWYWDWYYSITITGVALISFIAGYHQRKLTMARNKGVRFYHPKDNLCAVYDAVDKHIFQMHSVKAATKLLKTLNKLYYSEEIKKCQMQKIKK